MTRYHLQQGIPASMRTSGDMTVVFSPRIANVTVIRKHKHSISLAKTEKKKKANWDPNQKKVHQLPSGVKL